MADSVGSSRTCNESSPWLLNLQIKRSHVYLALMYAVEWNMCRVELGFLAAILCTCIWE